MAANSQRRARFAVSAAALISLAAAAGFLAAFQLSKLGAIQAISPFADDPPDAVASIGVQVALAGALIAAIRWVRLAGDPEFSTRRARLILPGCALVAASIGLTVLVDAASLVSSPPAPSPWASALIAGVVVVGLLGTAAGIATWGAWLGLRVLPSTEPTPEHPTFADLIEDGLAVVERTQQLIGRRVPSLSDWLAGAYRLVDRLWSWLNRSWISPRLHPWRFVIGVSLLCAAWLLTAKFIFEGAAPTALVGFKVVAIFVGVELAAVLGGYLIFGGWLGIRPPLIRRA